MAVALKSDRYQCSRTDSLCYKGGFFYEAWVITLKIKLCMTTCSLERDWKDIPVIIKLLCRQIFDMISCFHVDLHSGNVVVCSEGVTYILDFDKATICRKCSQDKLRKKYARRWRRAVLKHDLPAPLNNIFPQNLFCISNRQAFTKSLSNVI